MDTGSLLKAVRDSATHLLDAEGCSVALLESGAQRLALDTWAGERFAVPLGSGISGWVARAGEPALSNDVARDRRFYAEIDRKTGFETRSILCAPLRDGPRTLGSIQVLNTTRASGFRDADLELLEALAAIAVTALGRGPARAARVDRHALVLGRNAVMRALAETLRVAARSSATILLLGESGAGKEVLARAVHRWSPRADGPFVAINCVSLTPELLESELFGHERGAFTGAVSQKRGKFELANGGTIFLDEIGDLAPPLQAKLLRVLQEREFQRVGGVRDIRSDVRVIAATNRDLSSALADGSFRSDLYYRLNVVSLTVPPLRERRDDIPALVERFTRELADELGRGDLRVCDAALDRLVAHDWPGNVRELHNALERAAVLSRNDVLRLDDFPPEVAGGGAPAMGAPAIPEDALPLSAAVEAYKARRVRTALEQAGGHQTSAAELLGMRQSNLSRLIKALGIRSS